MVCPGVASFLLSKAFLGFMRYCNVWRQISSRPRARSSSRALKAPLVEGELPTGWGRLQVAQPQPGQIIKPGLDFHLCHLLAVLDLKLLCLI